MKPMQGLAAYLRSASHADIGQSNIDTLREGAKEVERAAQPDCRTCAKAMNLRSNAVFCANPLGVICTNGDKYEAAPKVVLWRTE